MLLLALFALTVFAQDPATGWLGYATGVNPGAGRISFIEMYWKCGATPQRSSSFYSPWFGIETSDNLNLLQPVNPWTGSQWEIYNEYFQWSPERNQNSASHVVAAGSVLYGSITLNDADHSYMLYHKDMTSGWSVNMSIPIQQKNGVDKNYTIIYVVYEKVAPCANYPPDGIVTFYDIKVQYEGKDATSNVKWTTAYVENVCNNRAHINSPTNISITWDTKFDENTKAVEGVHGLNEGKILAQ